MISGIKQVTVTASATSVVLSKIDPRNSSYTKGPLTKKGIDGKLHRFKDAALLVITAFDNENFAQLETWMRAKTSITHIEVMGVDEHVYWKVATALIVKKNYGMRAGGLNSYTFMVRQKGDDLSDIYTTGALE